jgi:hypothetical protein
MKAFYDFQADAITALKHEVRNVLWALIGASVMICGFIGAVAKSESPGSGIALGAAIGLVVGVPIALVLRTAIVHKRAATLARQNYVREWCEENEFIYHGDVSEPYGGPTLRQLETAIATDMVEGRVDGMSSLFYNLTYGDSGDGGARCFKVMRLAGKKLPIRRLSWTKRGLDSIRPVDKAKGAFRGERLVSLESAEFNDRFDLMVDDDADEIWIRRIFDPATIAACTNGSLRIPDLRYYDESWWLVEKEHFEPGELDYLKQWQARAAAIIDRLSRVQDL